MISSVTCQTGVAHICARFLRDVTDVIRVDTDDLFYLAEHDAIVSRMIREPYGDRNANVTRLRNAHFCIARCVSRTARILVVRTLLQSVDGDISANINQIRKGV